MLTSVTVLIRVSSDFFEITFQGNIRRNIAEGLKRSTEPVRSPNRSRVSFLTFVGRFLPFNAIYVSDAKRRRVCITATPFASFYRFSRRQTSAVRR